LLKELREVKSKCDAGKKIYCEALGEKRGTFIETCGERALPAELRP